MKLFIIINFLYLILNLVFIFQRIQKLKNCKKKKKKKKKKIKKKKKKKKKKIIFYQQIYSFGIYNLKILNYIYVYIYVKIIKRSFFFKF